MTKYYGELKSKGQADRWAHILEKAGTPIARSAASRLRLNWHAIAARPAEAKRYFDLVESVEAGL